MEDDKYNYITATYYLLAERLLKRNLIENKEKVSSSKKFKRKYFDEHEVCDALNMKSKLTDYIEQIDDDDGENELVANDNASTNRRRDFLPFAIPEEVEENLIENNDPKNIVFKWVF